MREITLVGLGGFAGSVLRYKVGALLLHTSPNSQFPWATLIVNGVGCLLIGIIATMIERFTSYNAELRLLLLTGVLGGFTTFSAFGLETLLLIRNGSIILAFINIASNFLIGILSVWLGLILVNSTR